MKRNLLWTISCMVLWVSFFAGQSLAVCPEDPNDNGECDTLYVEVYPGDEALHGTAPHFARFPIYVTHDVPDPAIDSIAAFVVPLCWEHTNPSIYCSLSSYWNNTALYPSPYVDQSIFRHIIDDGDTTLNWMMSLSENSPGSEWNTRMLDVWGSHFWLGLFPTGSEDQLFWEGSRALLVTMTFKLQDSTTICIDSCFWPPSERLWFVRSDHWSYIPRHNLPLCQPIGWQVPLPEFVACPQNEGHHTNGFFFESEEFLVVDSAGEVVSVSADFSGSGVAGVGVGYLSGYDPPKDTVMGWVGYNVIDHCQPGGTITLTARNDEGGPDYCDFNIMLYNNPPYLNLPDTWRALAENFTMALRVSATDPDEDEVTIQLEDYWYEPDSLHSPANPPSYDGGNPGLLTWAPTEADTGLWIFQFSATDACNEAVTHQMAIQVGMPFCGDCTGDGNVNVSDFIYLISYLFREGSAPDPLCVADVNCDGLANAGDLVFLLNFYYKFGIAPCFDCCP